VTSAPLARTLGARASGLWQEQALGLVVQTDGTPLVPAFAPIHVREALAGGASLGAWSTGNKLDWPAILHSGMQRRHTADGSTIKYVGWEGNAGIHKSTCSRFCRNFNFCVEWQHLAR
jgi:hypothetical protein